MTSALQAGDRRRSRRGSTRMLAQLQSDEQESTGEIVNLSRDGAKVRVNETWEIGTEISMAIEPFGRCSGKVIWSTDGVVGVKFTEEYLMLTLLIGGWFSFLG